MSSHFFDMLRIGMSWYYIRFSCTHALLPHHLFQGFEQFRNQFAPHILNAGAYWYEKHVHLHTKPWTMLLIINEIEVTNACL